MMAAAMAVVAEGEFMNAELEPSLSLVFISSVRRG